MNQFEVKNRIFSDILSEGDNINVEKIYDYVTHYFNFNKVQIQIT